MAECDSSPDTSDSVGEARPVSYLKLGMNGYPVLEIYGSKTLLIPYALQMFDNFTMGLLLFVNEKILADTRD